MGLQLLSGFRQPALVQLFVFNSCFPYRCQPSLCCSPAVGPSRPPGVGGALEGAEAEGCDAVRRCGGVCVFGLRDRSWPAYPATPGQAGAGPESTGGYLLKDKW